MHTCMSHTTSQLVQPLPDISRNCTLCIKCTIVYSADPLFLLPRVLFLRRAERLWASEVVRSRCCRSCARVSCVPFSFLHCAPPALVSARQGNSEAAPLRSDCAPVTDRRRCTAGVVAHSRATTREQCRQVWLRLSDGRSRRRRRDRWLAVCGHSVSRAMASQTRRQAIASPQTPGHTQSHTDSRRESGCSQHSLCCWLEPDSTQRLSALRSPTQRTSAQRTTLTDHTLAACHAHPIKSSATVPLPPPPHPVDRLQPSLRRSSRAPTSIELETWNRVTTIPKLPG